MCTSSCVMISAISACDACCSRLLQTTTLSGVGPMTKARALDSAPRLRHGRHCSDSHSVFGFGRLPLLVFKLSPLLVFVRVEVAANRCCAAGGSFSRAGLDVGEVGGGGGGDWEAADVHCRVDDVMRLKRRVPVSMALSFLSGGSASMIRLGRLPSIVGAVESLEVDTTTGISTWIPFGVLRHETILLLLLLLL